MRWICIFYARARGLIDVTLVDRLMHNSITGYWEKIHPVIYETRKGQPADKQPHFDSFENLYNLVKNMK